MKHLTKTWARFNWFIILAFITLTGFSMLAQGADFYVRPSATGNNSGIDWNNAWTFSTINWPSLRPGDTIWVAGGTYSSSLNIQASGVSGSPISIKRVLASDGVPVSAPGWSNSFDSLINITGSPGISDPASNFVTIDGRIDYGIQVTMPAKGGDGIKAAQSASIDNLKLYHIDVLGPYCTTSNPCNTGAYGVNVAPSFNQVTNMLVNHCRVRGISEGLRASNWNNVIVEYSIIEDTENDGVDHEDVIYFYTSSNVTLRYNIIRNSPNDGLFFEFGGATNFRFYGNVFYASTFSFLTTKSPGNYGPIYIYNNVFQAPSATNYGWIQLNGTIASASEVANNVFMNVSNSTAGANSHHNAYNYTTLNGYSWPSNEAGSFTFSTNPFVNSAAGDFHLASASVLANRGVALSNDGFLNKDMDGNVRGADGAWDVGAFESNGQVLPPPPSPTPTVTPTPTPTPAPRSQSLLTNLIPTLLDSTDGPQAQYELGMRFSSSVAGKITAIRFYKSNQETGVHVGKIYSSGGQLLASAIFMNESGSQWQTVKLSQPLSISANLEYVVSVNTSNTHYVASVNAMSKSIKSGNLISAAGNNGVYGPVNKKPSLSWNNTNYFRDIIFTPN